MALSSFLVCISPLSYHSGTRMGMVKCETSKTGRQQGMLPPLDHLPAKAGGAAGGGAYAPFILTARWLGWLCYEFRPCPLVLREFVDTLDYQIKTKSRYRFPFHFSSYQIVVLKSYLFHCHANDDKEDNLVVSILLG